MNQKEPRKKIDPETAALMYEAYEAVRPQSVYWASDHPTEDRISRAAKPDPRTTNLAEGCRESMAAAHRMLMAAHAKRRDLSIIADRLMATVRDEIKPHIHEMLRAVFTVDIRRAQDERRHWAEYANHFDKQQGAPAKLTRDAFTPPWQDEELDIESERKF